ncbi:MAG: PIN domain-containing protein, partial [Planctomycetes bacterium]|nr:PIN domain-containing protein [Planctomycetota bacterium]
FRQKKIALLSAIFIGLLAGLVLSNFIMLALVPFLSLLVAVGPEALTGHPAYVATNLVVHSTVCYLCVSFLLQTKDDFRFIIPYVEFAKESKGIRPLLIDTSVIIDGRIADMAETGVFDNALVVPGFVLQELQMVADSSDKLKRNRGRRGLDVLNRLRVAPKVSLETNETELPEFQNVRHVDQRLVLLAKHLNAKIVTNDFNLNKLARLQGIEVVNLNDVANSLKPVVLPGEAMIVRLTKPGDQPGQGVGYLDDGTMVVAEQGRGMIGEEVRLVVTSVLQTSAGRMIFGRIEGPQPRTPREPPSGPSRAAVSRGTEQPAEPDAAGAGNRSV